MDADYLRIPARHFEEAAVDGRLIGGTFPQSSATHACSNVWLLFRHVSVHEPVFMQATLTSFVLSYTIYQPLSLACATEGKCALIDWLESEAS